MPQQGRRSPPLDACNALEEVPGFQVNASGYSELSNRLHAQGTDHPQTASHHLCRQVSPRHQQ